MAKKWGKQTEDEDDYEAAENSGRSLPLGADGERAEFGCGGFGKAFAKADGKEKGEGEAEERGGGRFRDGHDRMNQVGGDPPTEGGRPDALNVGGRVEWASAACGRAQIGEIRSAQATYA